MGGGLLNGKDLVVSEVGDDLDRIGSQAMFNEDAVLDGIMNRDHAAGICCAHPFLQEKKEEEKSALAPFELRCKRVRHGVMDIQNHLGSKKSGDDGAEN